MGSTRKNAAISGSDAWTPEKKKERSDALTGKARGPYKKNKQGCAKTSKPHTRKVRHWRHTSLEGTQLLFTSPCSHVCRYRTLNCPVPCSLSPISPIAEIRPGSIQRVCTADEVRPGDERMQRIHTLCRPRAVRDVGVQCLRWDA
jgi:hypothetical protein